MIHRIEPGWLRTSDALHKRERRQRRRSRRRPDERVKRADDPQVQEVLGPEAMTPGTFDLVA